MPQQQPIVTPGDPTFDVEVSPGVQVAHPSSTIPPRGPLPEWRSSTNAGLPPHPYRAASIVVTAVILSRSAEIRWRHPQRPRSDRPLPIAAGGPLRLFRVLRDASGATAWAGVAAKAASTL
jgi:hypothetical protein